MATPSPPDTAFTLLHAKLREESAVIYHRSPEDAALNREYIIRLCRDTIPLLQYNLTTAQQDTTYNLFSLLCDPELFSRLDLWSHDQEIMSTALALYSVLPPTVSEAYHVKHVANYFSQACKFGTARNRLMLSLLQGPKAHWKSSEIENLYYTIVEMEGDVGAAEEYRDQPISSVKDFLDALETLSRSNSENRKAAKETLYSTVFSLLCDDRLKLYPDVFHKLHGYTLVKKCIQSQHLDIRAMDNLDCMIGDQQLEQWFPRSGKRVNALAQSYPRLQAMLEKRTLSNCVNTNTTTVKRKI